jgi:hypothetical protein
MRAERAEALSDRGRGQRLTAEEQDRMAHAAAGYELAGSSVKPPSGAGEGSPRMVDGEWSGRVLLDLVRVTVAFPRSTVTAAAVFPEKELPAGAVGGSFPEEKCSGALLPEGQWLPTTAGGVRQSKNGGSMPSAGDCGISP